MALDLCFEEAALKRQQKQISDEEYLSCITAHFAGTRHGQDGKCGHNSDLELHFTDPLGEVDIFASRVRAWSQEMKPVQDTKPLYATLHAYLINDTKAYKQSMSDLIKTYGTETRQNMHFKAYEHLASIALAEKKPDMLRAILQEDVKNFRPFHDFFDKNYYDYSRSGSEPELVQIALDAGYKDVFVLEWGMQRVVDSWH